MSTAETETERRAVDDEAQVIALAEAEAKGVLPDTDRRHETPVDAGAALYHDNHTTPGHKN